VEEEILKESPMDNSSEQPAETKEQNIAEKQNPSEPVEGQNKYLEQLQYLQADFQNYKRRIEKQKFEWQDDAVRNLLLQLLPVLDDFELYFQQFGAGADDKSAKGIRLIYEKLTTILKNAGVEKVSTEGLFDPEKHEAVHVEEKDDVPHGHILQVWRSGYSLKDRLLRPARVKVAETKKVKS
jgi:molecular chaperone GrpE